MARWQLGPSCRQGAPRESWCYVWHGCLAERRLGLVWRSLVSVWRSLVSGGLDDGYRPGSFPAGFLYRR